MLKQQLRLFAGTSAFLIVALGSCKSGYEKLRTGNNSAKKYSEAVKLYNNKEYAKAYGLLEQLMIRTHCVLPPEDLYYYYAYTNYKLKDYPSARRCFNYILDTYTLSPRSEEHRFMSAYCEYWETPPFPLDQDKTSRAIGSLQHFIDLYPKSEHAADAAKLIQNLREKLVEKLYANAKMYFGTDDWQAAIISLDNILRDYPDTKYAEELKFIDIKAACECARHSPGGRQADLFYQCIRYARQFIETYPASKYLKEVKDCISYCNERIAKSKNILAIAPINPTMGRKND